MDEEPTRFDRGYDDVIKAFSEVAEAINDDVELDALLHAVARNICTLIGVRRCSVYLKDAESGLYRGQVAHTGLNQDDLIKRLTCGTPADGLTREILETKAPVVVANAQLDPRPVRATMRSWGVRTMLGVPMIVRQNVIGLLFLDNADIPFRFTEQDQELASTFADLAAIAISQATKARELRESLATVARQNEVLRMTAAMEDRLTTLAISGVSLTGIATAVAQLTDKPCAIHDASYRRMATGVPADETAPLPQLLEPEVRSQPEVAAALAGLRPTRPSVVGPLPAAGLHRRCLVAPLAVRDEHWGYLVVMEHGRRFTALDVAVARRSAMLIALELSAERRCSIGAGQEMPPRDTVLRGLLDASDDDPTLVRRAEFHGIRAGEPHVVCVMAPREDDERLPSAEEIEMALSSGPRAPRVWAIHNDDGTVSAVVEADPDAPAPVAARRAKEHLARVAATIAPEGGMLVALSTVCASATEYRRGHDEARQALHCLATLDRSTVGVSVLAAHELGAGRLFLSSVERPEAERFVSDTLGALIDPDEPRMGDVLGTLNVFFACSRSVRDSAQCLGVHENTVRYRLARATELTGLDILTNADDQLAAQVAILVLRIAGRLPVQPAGDDRGLVDAAPAATEPEPAPAR
jgi:GAF domain-containing protein/sugar diacid utilization regulator